MAVLVCALVLAMIGWLWAEGFSLTGLQRRPQVCVPYQPDSVEALLAVADKLGFAGVQISVRDRNGNWFNCAAGWADRGGLGEPMSTQHRMRFLSLSKVLTSVLSVKLVREGRLDLDHRLVEVLGLGRPYADPRISSITLRQLLSHTAGFDRGLTSDPMMVKAPWCPNRVEQLAYMKLDFSPGDRFAYSNLGYCLMGEAIERTTGQQLAALIRDELLRPAGVMDLAPVSNGVQRPDESRLHIDPAEPFDVLNHLDYDAMHATGAWSGTTGDFGRLMEKIFLSPAPDDVLDLEGRSLLTAVAGDCDSAKWRHCHGLGLYRYRRAGGPTIYWRDGSLNGGTAFFALSEDGQIVVWVANSRYPGWRRINDSIGESIYRYIRGSAGGVD